MFFVHLCRVYNNFAPVGPRPRRAIGICRSYGGNGADICTAISGLDQEVAPVCTPIMCFMAIDADRR